LSFFALAGDFTTVLLAGAAADPGSCVATQWVRCWNVHLYAENQMKGMVSMVKRFLWELRTLMSTFFFLGFFFVGVFPVLLMATFEVRSDTYEMQNNHFPWRISVPIIIPHGLEKKFIWHIHKKWNTYQFAQWLRLLLLTYPAHACFSCQPDAPESKVALLQLPVLLQILPELVQAMLFQGV
jgi:hypothetical protein